MDRLRRGGAIALTVLTGLVVATGWMYWSHALVAHLPGPRLVNALPLDALSQHDSVPDWEFLAVFLAVGALSSARRHWSARPVGVVLVGLFAWAVMTTFDTASLFTVRQVPFTQALTGALRLVPCYLAAALVAIGAARPMSRRPILDRVPAGKSSSRLERDDAVHGS